jgi:hypothetical protein
VLDGVVGVRSEGTPQGGPLSPLLSNILLDELDKELEKRGHAFCRYADDCNIYVHSRRAGEEGESIAETVSCGAIALACQREEECRCSSVAAKVLGLHDDVSQTTAAQACASKKKPEYSYAQDEATQSGTQSKHSRRFCAGGVHTFDLPR